MLILLHYVRRPARDSRRSDCGGWPKAPGAPMIASVTFIAILTTILIQAPTTQWLGRRWGLLEDRRRL